MGIVDKEVFAEVEQFMKARVHAYTVEAAEADEGGARASVQKVYSLMVSSVAVLGDLLGYAYDEPECKRMQDYMIYILRSCAGRAAKQRREEHGHEEAE